MFCPLLVIANSEIEIGLSSAYDCLKEDCAWWLPTDKQCSITVLAQEASYKLWERAIPKIN